MPMAKGNGSPGAGVAKDAGFQPTDNGKKFKMLLWIVVGLVAWVVASVVLAPIVGLALRRSDALERARSVEVLQARAQHPANRAA
jgi:hypothetical protein